LSEALAHDAYEAQKNDGLTEAQATAFHARNVTSLTTHIDRRHLEALGGRATDLIMHRDPMSMAYEVGVRADTTEQLLQVIGLLQTALARMEGDARDALAGRAPRNGGPLPGGPIPMPPMQYSMLDPFARRKP
jgi:hypothetical protein